VVTALDRDLASARFNSSAGRFELSTILIENCRRRHQQKATKPGELAMFNRACSFTNSSPLALRSRKQRHFLKILFALAFTVVATLPAAATDKTEVVATVRKFVDSFNKGDMKALTATCADQVSIIDEFPPYEWHGAGACTKWTDDYGADAKKNGITDSSLTLGAPLHVDVTADRAYVVVPANYKFKQNGKAVQETGSTLTIALQKSGDAWRITGWAWAKH
jgi:ketosteroid isomerase-like protein